MTYANIALMGRARSGKDTVAARLVDDFGYARVAFADPLKDMALELDPFVNAYAEWHDDLGETAVIDRLSEIVRDIGWERAKEEYPEVRRILQHIGQGVRKHQPNFWLNIAVAQMGIYQRAGVPVVVTDCRYLNEAGTLRSFGFRMVRITRPDMASPAPYGDHESETALRFFPADETITNDGSLEKLQMNAGLLTYGRKDFG